jgi:hypothetical protein
MNAPASRALVNQFILWSVQSAFGRRHEGGWGDEFFRVVPMPSLLYIGSGWLNLFDPVPPRCAMCDPDKLIVDPTQMLKNDSSLRWGL